MSPIHPFVRRLVLSAAATCVLLAGLVTGFLVLSNEWKVFSDAVVDDADQILWGPGFGQQNGPYKLRRSFAVRPEMVFLGSSRVTQFRDVMAPKGLRFFNASLAASSLTEALNFERALFPRVKPRILLLGIDPWWFRPDRGTGDSQPTSIEFSYSALVSAVFRAGLHLDVLRNLVSGDLIGHIDSLGHRRAVGYMASTTDNGFRPDGSYQYGDILTGRYALGKLRRMGREFGFSYYRTQVTGQTGRFAYVGAPDPRQADILGQIVAEARNSGVDLVLFFPPMAEGVMEAIRQTPAQARYMKEVADMVARVAAETGVPFFNRHDLAALGISDDHTLDGIHVDEIASLAALRSMIDGSPALDRLYGQEGRDQLDRLLTKADRWADPRRLVP